MLAAVRRFGWVLKVWQRWLALIGAISTLTGVVVFALAHGREGAWIAIAGLLVLVVALAWTAYDEHSARLAAERALALPASETREQAARRLLEAAIERGRQLENLPAPTWQPGAEYLRAKWEEWSSPTARQLGEMFGPGLMHEFVTAPDHHTVDARKYAEPQVAILKALLERPTLPLLGDWKPTA